jgi:DNA-binding LacI/PurR family transcriptional regulator/signal transduction histidine kinase/CheY-like chemotaxis protein
MSPSARPETARPTARPESRRLTIAVLIDNANFFHGCYEASLREALDAKCRQAGHNLLLLYGGALDDPGPTGTADNTIFRAVTSGSFDGIIVASSMLAAFCGSAPVLRLLEGYRPAPLCSIGVALPGIPSLVLDNRAGMEAVVEHMIRDHGVRRPAFLAGTPNNPEAQERRDAFEAVLARNDIPFDPSLVACGYFMPEQGRAAMESLLAKGRTFDAVVAANDNMALGAIQALRKWGIRVPRDVPVTGFDDLPLAAEGNPPLTTVAQPFARMAEMALDSVLAQLAGEQVPEIQVIPSQFMRRRSCGCAIEHRLPNQHGAPTREPPDCLARIATMEPTLTNSIRLHPDDAALVSHRLVESLRNELTGRRGAFLKGVGDLLEDIGDSTEQHGVLQEAIGWLRDELSEVERIDLERVFYDSLALIGSSSTTMQVRKNLMMEDNYTVLRKVSGHISVAFDLPSLRQTLIEGFPTAGIRTAFLSCATDAKTTEMTPLVCLVDGHDAPDPEVQFPSSQFVPRTALALPACRTFLVFPIAVESQLLGVAAFDHADGARSYAVFRNEITGVLRNIHLHQELVQKTMLHERSVQERLSATKRMEALSVLAGGVAHDLNNALGPLVALPDLIMRDLGQLQGDANTITKMSSDVEIIKTSALRAAQTIKDLLTLGRQGRIVKQAIDLNRVVKSCVAESSLRLVQDKSRYVNIVIDYSTEALSVRGSDSQLARAIGNLLRNAIEAIDERGEIVVRTRREILDTAASRYENIPPGTYAVVTVADDGCGIEPQDLVRVFEPFFTRKRTCESSGSGLGLAIVHGVVKEHDGFIDLTSVRGRGTSFSLFFPVAPTAAPSAAPSPPVTPASSRILIVDDEHLQRRMCQRVLTGLGYRVETMETGSGAYEAFKRAHTTGRSPYDLIVMDMALGENVDGLQIVELIQQLFPNQRVIMASGHAPNERAELAVDKGLVWLEKPYTVEALTQAVQSVLRTR